jgi:hypothetical protein
MVNNDNIKVKGLLRCCNVGLYHNNWPRTVESSWNVMAHGDAREGKWRGNWRIKWVDSTLHTTSEHGVSSITTADAHTSAASSWLNWRLADLNGLVLFAERRNLVSGRVPSHFKRSLLPINIQCRLSKAKYGIKLTSVTLVTACRWMLYLTSTLTQELNYTAMRLSLYLIHTVDGVNANMWHQTVDIILAASLANPITNFTAEMRIKKQ